MFPVADLRVEWMLLRTLTQVLLVLAGSRVRRYRLKMKEAGSRGGEIVKKG